MVGRSLPFMRFAFTTIGPLYVSRTRDVEVLYVPWIAPFEDLIRSRLPATDYGIISYGQWIAASVERHTSASIALFDPFKRRNSKYAVSPMSWM